MEKQTRKTAKAVLIGICMLAAGICYSCGRDVSDLTGRGEPFLETVQAEKTGGEASGSKTPDSETGGSKTPDSEVFDSEAAASEITDLKPTGETSVPYYVHVCGEVINPGVYEVEAGSRVFQAVELAGGFTAEAAGEYLNMAEPVQDGMKILVPSREEAASSGPTFIGGTVVPGSAGQPSKVNINTADREQLMTLKGIGEARAEDIIRYREEHGPFQAIEEIMEVSGIKDAAFQKIKEDITV